MYSNKSSIDNKPTLICLKYWDISTQTIYFAKWIYIYDKETKINDLANYVENKLLKNDNKYYFDKLTKYLKKMKSFDISEERQDHFIFYEECDSAKGHIFQLSYDKQIKDEFRDGDIFVYQINPYHEYFRQHPIAIMVQSLYNQSHTNAYKQFGDFMNFYCLK